MKNELFNQQEIQIICDAYNQHFKPKIPINSKNYEEITIRKLITALKSSENIDETVSDNILKKLTLNLKKDKFISTKTIHFLNKKVKIELDDWDKEYKQYDGGEMSVNPDIPVSIKNLEINQSLQDDLNIYI